MSEDEEKDLCELNLAVHINCKGYIVIYRRRCQLGELLSYVDYEVGERMKKIEKKKKGFNLGNLCLPVLPLCYEYMTFSFCFIFQKFIEIH